MLVNLFYETKLAAATEAYCTPSIGFVPTIKPVASAPLKASPALVLLIAFA